MSKREPLLGDGWIDSHELPRKLYGEERVAMEVGMRLMRHEYESLIDSGKLLVVEECGYVPADTWRSVCICKGCGEACSDAG